jgi:hypothetical protein
MNSYKNGMPSSAGVSASFWESACRACGGLGTLLQGANMPADAKAGDEVRGLPLERDAVASVCADRSGVVADRTRYRRGAQEDGSVPMGADAG